MCRTSPRWRALRRSAAGRPEKVRTVSHLEKTANFSI
jgi:hypothetical protein